MKVGVVWTLAALADAVVDLTTASDLTERTVFVPNERAAHSLRRALIERGSQRALIGTRFTTLLQFARELLLTEGETAAINDRELGPILVREAFSEVAFSRYDRDDLLTLPGWDDAFAQAIGAIESAGLSANDLLAHADSQVTDVGRVHETLRRHAELVTPGALLLRAADVARLRPMSGAKLVAVTGFESLAEVALLRALPELVYVQWGVRPLRIEHTQRAAKLFGDVFAGAPSAPRSEGPARDALRHLQAHLFSEAPKTAAPSDDSVRIATYAGVHEEVEAAVGWVVEQLVERGLPAHEIAILAPVAEPYHSLLRARLGALPWPEAREPTVCERGVPLTQRSDGARLLLAIQALRHGLSREMLAPLLPILRGEEQTSVRGLSRAWQLLNTVAAMGGERENLAGGGVWPDAWRQALARARGGHAAVGGSAPEDREQLREAELHRDLSALLTPIEALTELLSSANDGAPLHALWLDLSVFAQRHLRLPPAIPPTASILDGALAAFADHQGREPTGSAALAWLEDTLTELVVKSGRFGVPSVYLGTCAGVRGSSFRALRVIGLVEGSLPSAVREDPVLSDAARKQLSPFLLTSRQLAHRQIATFDFAVHAARESLALSAPRVSVEGSTRQPAAVFLDVMRALFGAHDARSLEEQLEDAASAGRATERRLRERLIVPASARLDRLARGDVSLGRDELNPVVDLEALRAIRERSEPTAQDGLLGGLLPSQRIAGLSAERPISASRLATLLSCPHHYLYEHVLGFREAEAPLPAHALHVMTFGTWLHAVAEEYWQRHGPQLGARKPDIVHHGAELRALALQRFKDLRQTYPFANEDVAGAARQALCDQLDSLLTLDWNQGQPRAFIAVERSFGYDQPCSLETAAGELYVRGKIDKLDREGSAMLVRDIKTGAGKPRSADEPPDLSIDLQLGVYALVAKRMAEAWGTPSAVGVAYIYLRSGDPDRSWRGEHYTQLEQAVQEWLATAHETLKQGAFVRSARRDDCKYCAYLPVCTPELERAPVVLKDSRVPRRLAQLKAEDAA